MGSVNVKEPKGSSLSITFLVDCKGSYRRVERGVELCNLTGAMNNIHDTLGGSMVCITFLRSLLILFLLITPFIVIAPLPPSIPTFPSPHLTLTTQSQEVFTVPHVFRAKYVDSTQSPHGV
jgi:hypothetical protein